MEYNSEAQIKNAILELSMAKPDALFNQDINEALPTISNVIIAKAINELISEGNLKLFVNQGKTPFYKYGVKAPLSTETLKTKEEAVLRLINDAGNKGLWSKDIMSQLHLSNVEKTKIIKSLKSKELIKEASETGSRQKCFMLYNLEHDRTKTNSFWYESQGKQFINSLHEWCKEYLENKSKIAKEKGGGCVVVRDNSYATATEVHQYITQTKGCSNPLEILQVDSILYTIVLDNKAERVKNKEGEFLYKVSSNWLRPPGIVKIPCGGCPVKNKCDKVGSITPESCKYFDKWLEN